MRFIFDEMLKNLASWCRILGLDSEFFPGGSDSALLEHAKQSGRILITRDTGLAKRCERHGVRCIFIENDGIEEQLAQLLKESGAEPTFPEKTRCASCNGELEDVPKESVKDDVGADTFAHTRRFWRCSRCGKVFWEGGHWKNIRRIYEDARQKGMI